MFIVVPVIDLLDGQAVQARHGDRQSYKPLCTPLSRSSDPLAVTEAYLSLHPFGQIYVADLDAIRGANPNLKIIAALRERLPKVQIWVDGGFRNHPMLSKLSLPGIRPVIGSETLTDTGLLRAAKAPILSLDYHQGRFLGPASLQTDVRSWPRDVIIMSMSRIGCDAGPDWQRLRDLRLRAPATRLYAAGGVRGFDDLRTLAATGVHGALVSTALHKGALSAATLASISQLPTQRAEI